MQPSDNRVVLQRLQDTVIVPLPDPLGPAYLQALNSALLESLHAQSTRGVVLDMSGVELLDADDFAQLHRIWQTTCLMGTGFVMAGIKPGIAAALTLMNVPDEWVLSALSVEHAMEKLR